MIRNQCFITCTEVGLCVLPTPTPETLCQPPPPPPPHTHTFAARPPPPCCFPHLFTHPPPLFFFFRSISHSLLFPRCQPNFDTPYSDYWLLSFCERRANLHVVAAWSVPVLLQARLRMVPTLHAQQDVVGTLLLFGIMSGVGARAHTQTHLRAQSHTLAQNHMHARAHALTHTGTHTLVYTHTGSHRHWYTHTHTHWYTRALVHTQVHVLVHTHTHSRKQKTLYFFGDIQNLCKFSLHASALILTFLDIGGRGGKSSTLTTRHVTASQKLKIGLRINPRPHCGIRKQRISDKYDAELLTEKERTYILHF